VAQLDQMDSLVVARVVRRVPGARVDRVALAGHSWALAHPVMLGLVMAQAVAVAVPGVRQARAMAMALREWTVTVWWNGWHDPDAY